MKVFDLLKDETMKFWNSVALLMISIDWKYLGLSYLGLKKSYLD